MRFFGREPAVWLTLIATSIRLIGAFVVDLTDDQQTLLNAVASAAGGLVVAMMVRSGAQLAAIIGFIQALLACAVGFGLDMNAEEQAVIMSFVGTAAALFLGTQVTPPTPPAPVETR